MEHSSTLVERAYWLAWPMVRGHKSEGQIVMGLVAGGIPMELARHVAEDVSNRQHRLPAKGHSNLLSFGLFMLGIGLMVFLITFITQSQSAVVLPHLILLGGGVTFAGLARRVRIE